MPNPAFYLQKRIKTAENTKFFCPLLDIRVSGSPIIQDGERCDRRRWRRKGAERVAAVDKIKDQRKPEDLSGTATGKLVGAVTHVLVNDPTTGYGIFIENMLDAAA